MRKLVITATVLVGLAGCAHPMTFSPGPGVSQAQFEPDEAACDLMARHGGGSFVAWGSANYVAGAELGHAIGEVARTRADFRDCMEMKGWHLESASAVAAHNAAMTEARAAGASLKACIAAAVNDPRYADIRQFQASVPGQPLPPLVFQTNRLPTPHEAELLTALHNQVHPCTMQARAQLSAALPSTAVRFTTRWQQSDSIQAQLRARQITWAQAGNELYSVNHPTDTTAQR